MRKFSRTERVLFAAAVLFVAAWGVLSLGKDRHAPEAASRAADTGGRLAQRIAAKESAVRRLMSFHSRKTEIAAEAVKYRPYLAQERASPELEWSALLKEVETLAKKSSVRLAGVTPGPVLAHEGWSEYRVEIESESSPMSAILRFLGSLQASPELLKVVRLKIVSSPEKERSFRCSATLSKAAFSS